MPRKPKNPNPSPNPNPEPSGDYSGLRLDADQVPILDGSVETESASAPAETEAEGRVKCRYCGKEFSPRGIARHESRCPAREETTEAPAGVQLEAVQFAVGGIFQAIAARYGDHWRLTDDECLTLAAQWKAVLDAYAPALAQSKLLLLAFALLQTGAVIMPRLDKSRATRSAQSDRSKRDGEDNAAADVPVQ